MRITTAMNHERRFLSQIDYILYWLRASGKTFEWALAERAERVFEDPAWKRVPSWVQMRVNDRFGEGLRQMHMVVEHYGNFERRLKAARDRKKVHPGRYLRWQLRVDGKHVTSDEICKRRKAGDEDIWKRVEGAHIWNHLPENCYGEEGWVNTWGKIKSCGEVC